MKMLEIAPNMVFFQLDSFVNFWCSPYFAELSKRTLKSLHYRSMVTMARTYPTLNYKTLQFFAENENLNVGSGSADSDVYLDLQDMVEQDLDETLDPNLKPAPEGDPDSDQDSHPDPDLDLTLGDNVSIITVQSSS